MIHSINGKLVKENQLLISGKDLGLLRGFAVFDFLVTYENIPFMLDFHIDRLLRSAQLINLDHPWNTQQIKKYTLEVLAANDPSFDKTIKIVISGGESSDGFTVENKPQLLIIIDRWIRLSKEVYQKGVKIITSFHKRYLPGAKTNNYIEAIRLSGRIRKEGAFEVLYYDQRQVYECSRSNIFAVKNRQILTPKSEILKGATREVVIKNLELKVKEKDFSLKELLHADEVFITKSNDEIVPVVKIDDKFVGSDKVEPITKKIMNRFNNYISLIY